ncbi:FACT complex subunit [Klebsormidium nitens]|uniref:FACT complex subunit SSRP1 n=1 Tax=Klebsormidium nitens TaxID=105231 RepID=A0A1Y1I5H3_KLENI|nr:FACT complex subunit [Klebsormidium nitens]|eukprot:GAQ83368.1 FACT complex subunit [Klebsormidium nitens]
MAESSGSGVHQFNNIFLSMRSGLNPGQLKLHSGGLTWKKSGGGKEVNVSRNDISSLMWLRVPKGFQLAVKSRAGSKVKFNGFREQDVKALTPFLTSTYKITPEDKQLAINGRNWGEAEIDGNMLSFNVGSKQAFELALSDISQATIQGKNEVVLEMHVDDTSGEHEKDTLIEMSFHIPPTNTTYIGDEERTSAQRFYERILERADIGPSTGEAVVTFDEVAILTPRGRYQVELCLGFLRLSGQANDFKIQYPNIVRIFQLPKPNLPHTMIVITLDPPIRKGQTFYPHIVLQFPSEEEISVALDIEEQLLETKYKDKLEPTYKGLTYDVFSRILKNLADSKVTKPGQFKSHGDQSAVKCSYKAEEGFLYPLEKSFFYVHKPPILVLHDEIEYIQFERHSASASMGTQAKTFDLLVHLKTEAEHQFRNIQKTEYSTLFNFIRAKRIKILNLAENQDRGGGAVGAAAALDLEEEEMDPHLARIKNAREGGPAMVGEQDDDDSDDEDEDFKGGADSDGGSPTDSSDEEGSDASEDAGPKRKAAPKEKTPAKKKKAEKPEKGKDEKKKRKKKDPNAPKKSLSGFMFFSKAERERLKKENPTLPFTEIGKVCGEKWGKMSKDDKAPYEEQAAADKGRYKEALAQYEKNKKQEPAPVEESEEEEEEEDSD